MKHFFLASIVAWVVMGGVLPTTASAQNLSFETDNGWQGQLSGNLPIFLVASNHQNYSSDGSDQFATRLMSGFNPTALTFQATAPEQNGITVSAKFQINTHLQGESIQNDGLFESRFAEIIVEGGFGTINFGKGLGVYNSVRFDEGSVRGVGRVSGPDEGSSTLGRIGAGYTFSNFNPRLMYTTPNLGGIELKVAAINPEKPDGTDDRLRDIETATPRIEAALSYTTDLASETSLSLWTTALYQHVNVVSVNYDYNFTGWGVGSRFEYAGWALQGNYSGTNSIGADGLIGLNVLSGTGLDQADAKGDQWYVESTYQFGALMLGASYGEGAQDATATPVGQSPEITNKLSMAFARYALTNQLDLLGEVQDFSSNDQSDYQALVLGMNFSF